MTRWFRMYDDVVNDPKAQRLSDSAFRGWVNLMCLASKNDGLLEQPVESIAFALRKQLPKTRELLQTLQSAGLLDPVENGWKPHNWDTRQYVSDVSTGRVKRFRERSKTVSETPPETEQIQSRTEQKVSRASRFKEFWEVCPKKVGRGKVEGLFEKIINTGLNPDVLIDGMRRYGSSQAGKDPTYIAHPSTWLNQQRWLDEIAPGVPTATIHVLSPEIRAQEQENLKRFGVI